MPVTTDDLIRDLTARLSPVRPLPSPGRRAARWLCGAAIYLVLVFLAVRGVMGRDGVRSDLLYLMQQVSGVALGVAAAYAALASVIPGAGRRAMAGVFAAGACWLAAVVAGCLVDWSATGTVGVFSGTDWPCVVSMSAGGAILWGLLVPMLRSGVALSPYRSVALAGVAAMGMANLEACLTRPHAFHATVLLWHGGTAVLAVTLMAAATGRIFRPRLTAA